MRIKGQNGLENYWGANGAVSWGATAFDMLGMTAVQQTRSQHKIKINIRAEMLYIITKFIFLCVSASRCRKTIQNDQILIRKFHYMVR